MINDAGVTLWQFYHSYSYLNTILSWLLQTWPGPGVTVSLTVCLSFYISFEYLNDESSPQPVSLGLSQYWIMFHENSTPSSLHAKSKTSYMLELAKNKRRWKSMFYIHEVTLTGLTVLYFIVELFNNSSKGWGQSYLCLVSTSLSGIVVPWEPWREWDSNHIKVACSLVNNIVKTTKEIIPQDIDLSYREQSRGGGGGAIDGGGFTSEERCVDCLVRNASSYFLFLVSQFFPLHYSAGPELLVDQPHPSTARNKKYSNYGNLVTPPSPSNIQEILSPH